MSVQPIEVHFRARGGLDTDRVARLGHNSRNLARLLHDSFGIEKARS